jgi:hypothetical protein
LPKHGQQKSVQTYANASASTQDEGPVPETVQTRLR